MNVSMQPLDVLICHGSVLRSGRDFETVSIPAAAKGKAE